MDMVLDRFGEMGNERKLFWVYTWLHVGLNLIIIMKLIKSQLMFIWNVK